MREFAEFIMASRLRSILLTGLTGIFALLVPPVAILGGVAIALVSLRKGWLEGLAITIPATVLTTAAWGSFGSLPGFEFPLVWIFWPAVLLNAVALRATENQAPALLTAAGCAALYVLAMHLSVGDVAAFWLEWLKQAASQVPDANVGGLEDSGASRLMNGLLAMVLVLTTMFSLLAGRWLQALAFNPGGFGTEFRRLRLPRLVLPVIIGFLMGAGQFSQALLADLVMVSLATYFFVGLAIAHALIEARKLPWFAGIPVYLPLVFMPQFALVFLALVGAADAAIDLRALMRARR